MKGLKILFFTLFLGLIFSPNQRVYAGGSGGDGGEFNATELVMGHIADANEWHLVTWGDKHISIPLPCIVHVPGEGLKLFSSRKAAHGHLHEGFTLGSHGELIHENLKRGGLLEFVKGKSGYFYDFSISKNVATLLLTSLIMILIFFGVTRAYRRREGKAPKGLQSFMEPLILFVRDTIAKPNLGNKYEKFMPYLLTVFFFIWIANMLGQIPLIGGPNLTGNIAVTAVLSIITLLLTSFAGNKHYWGHIFNPPAPAFVKPILIPIEIIGIFTKPFALMIRLFANITAGHIIILSLTSLIFVFGKAGANTGGGITGLAMAIPFVLFMSVIELLVAFLQAFIFTMLSALFIGLAGKEHH